MIRWALTNYCFNGSVTYAGNIDGSTSTNPNYLPSNITSPERPFVPARTTNLNTTPTTYWQVDFGGSYPIDVVGVINANTGAFTLGLSNNAATVDGPTVSVNWMQNPYNWRINGNWRPTPGSYRYLRLTLNGTSPTRLLGYGWRSSYQVGGLFAGQMQTTPRDIGWDYKVTTVQPRVDVGPSHEGWRQRLAMGNPLVRLDMHRLVFRGTGAPGQNDQLYQWVANEIYWEQWDRGLVMLRDDFPEATWMMRRLSRPEWTVKQDFPESDWELEEVVR